MVALLFFASLSAALVRQDAAAQEQEKTPTTQEMAAKEADRLGGLLKLDDWQIYYVDSTLQYNYEACQQELKNMQTARVSNYSLYDAVRDKWMERTDSMYRTLFTEEQWKAYLKSGAAKQQKAREKRRLKTE